MGLNIPCDKSKPEPPLSQCLLCAEVWAKQFASIIPTLYRNVKREGGSQETVSEETVHRSCTGEGSWETGRSRTGLQKSMLDTVQQRPPLILK